MSIAGNKRDHDLIDFGADHELNYILKTIDKRQTQKNRDLLVEYGNECKASLNRTTIDHGTFFDYLNIGKDKVDQDFD